MNCQVEKDKILFLLFFQDDYIFGRYLVLVLNLIYITIFFDENNLNLRFKTIIQSICFLFFKSLTSVRAYNQGHLSVKNATYRKPSMMQHYELKWGTHV